MDMHKSSLVGLLSGFLLFAFMLPVAAQEEPTHVTVAIFRSLSNLPYAIAQEEGYFAAQNLEVEFVEGVDGRVLFPALIEGELDVHNPLNSSAFYNAIARGANIRAVADKGFLDPESCPSTAFVARTEMIESGAFEDPEQLPEMLISGFKEGDTGYFLTPYFEQLGLSFDDIQAEYLAPPAFGEALRNGSYAAGYVAEPDITRLLRQGDNSIWLAPSDLRPNFQTVFVAFGPSFLEENPDAGRRFMIAYRQAVMQFNEGKTERNLDIAEDFTGLERDLLEEACWVTLSEDSMINAESMVEFQEWSFELGLQDRVVQPEEFWDPSFVEYANEALAES